jgi:hypothetical protein
LDADAAFPVVSNLLFNVFCKFVTLPIVWLWLLSTTWIFVDTSVDPSIVNEPFKSPCKLTFLAVVQRSAVADPP